MSVDVLHSVYNLSSSKKVVQSKQTKATCGKSFSKFSTTSFCLKRKSSVCNLCIRIDVFAQNEKLSPKVSVFYSFSNRLCNALPRWLTAFFLLPLPRQRFFPTPCRKTNCRSRSRCFHVLPSKFLRQHVPRHVLFFRRGSATPQRT